MEAVEHQRFTDDPWCSWSSVSIGTPVASRVCPRADPRVRWQPDSSFDIWLPELRHLAPGPAVAV